MEKLKIDVMRSGGKHSSYELKYKNGMTVLDALIEIRETQDSSLAFRHSCRMGICGSCGMTINGLPGLACHTQVSELKTDTVRLEPMHNMEVARDLVVDIIPFFDLHKSVKPYLMRKNIAERDGSDREYKMLQEEVGKFLQFDYCIMCGLCYAACPTAALDPAYTGPQAITQALRYMADPRDEGWKERVDLLDTSHGVWRCHAAAACSFVCPKDVDPAKAIQMARVEVLKCRVLGKKGKEGSQLITLTLPGTRKEGTKPPPYDFPQGGGADK